MDTLDENFRAPDGGTGEPDEADQAGETGAAGEAGDAGGVVAAFGRQLKLLRQRAGLEREAFGKLVGYSPSSVASFEQGRRIPSPAAIDKADEVLGAGGLLLALKDEVAKAQYPAFFRDMAVLEAKAVGLSEYAVQVVPGLLQTDDYARAVLRMRRPVIDDEIIEQRVVARLARQAIYARRPAPLLSFLIEEVVLHRPIGGHDVLRGQLQQILLLAHNRNVDVQIMPTDREDHVGLAGAFTMIDADKGRRLAYAEAQGDSRLYSDHVKVHELGSRYGILRAQALTPRESLAHIEGLLGET